MSAPTERDLERCACVRCPTFVKGDARLFCIKGASTMQPTERGCSCRTCEVHIEHQLPGRAYCLRGRASEQQ